MRCWVKEIKKTVAILVLLAVVTGSVSLTVAAPRVTQNPGTTPVITPPPVKVPMVNDPYSCGDLFQHFWLWLTAIIH